MSRASDKPGAGLGGSIAGRVTEALRDDILSGRIAPGTRVKIQDLASRYGVSPLPVREALRRLEGDGLLANEPHRGATVRLPDAKAISDLYELREILEGRLVERAAARATPAAARSLERLVARWERAAADHAIPRLMEANRDLHARIAELGDNPEIAEAATRGWPLIFALRSRFGFSTGRLEEIGQQHRDLVAAIVAGDAPRARAVSRAHVEQARDELFARLAEGGMPGLAKHRDDPVPRRHPA